MMNFKKLLSPVCLALLPTFAFAQEESPTPPLQINGYKWFDAGSVVYKGSSLFTFEICALDDRANVINAMLGDTLIKPRACAYITGVDISLDPLGSGAMVKKVR